MSRYQNEYDEMMFKFRQLEVDQLKKEADQEKKIFILLITVFASPFILLALAAVILHFK